MEKNVVQHPYPNNYLKNAFERLLVGGLGCAAVIISFGYQSGKRIRSKIYQNSNLARDWKTINVKT